MGGTGTIIAIVVMLLSALTYAVSFVLQHKGTQAVVAASESAGGSGGMGKLVTNKIWVIGVLLMGVAFIMHLVALKFGSVAVVQPLVVAELIFIPPVAYLISKTKIVARQWVAIVVVAAALAGFLVIAKPTEGDAVPSGLAWTLVIGGCTVAVVLLIVIGERLPLQGRAALCGIAAGVVNAMLAIVAKGAFEAPSMFTSPLFYITLILCFATLYVNAIAFKRGPITISSPAMIAINPVVSVVMAMILFDDMITTTPFAIAAIIVCCIAVGIGIVVLTQAEAAVEEDVAATWVAVEGEIVTDIKHDIGMGEHHEKPAGSSPN
mgnify:FL=1